MKIRHRAHFAPPVDPEWAARVEREAERTTNRASEAYARNQERLARAEERLARAELRVAELREGKRQQRVIDRAVLAVEQRRQEMLAIHREMQASPSGSQHRGRGSHRHLPMGSVL